MKLGDIEINGKCSKCGTDQIEVSPLLDGVKLYVVFSCKHCDINVEMQTGVLTYTQMNKSLPLIRKALKEYEALRAEMK